MTFTSYSFLIFFCICTALYYLVPSKLQNAVLLIASYVFYMWKLPQYGMLVLFATAVSYFCAFIIDRQSLAKNRKRALVLSLAALVSTLAVFKYFNFFSGTLVTVLGWFGLLAEPVALNLALPIGISFYTFQTMGYCIDVYRGKLVPERSFIDYSLFASFFPQILSGPIGRADELLPQYKKRRTFEYGRSLDGATRFLSGLFKKIVVADCLGIYASYVFNDPGNVSGISLAVLGAGVYALQIYFDFAGYTDMAVGAAKILGISLRENFCAPYLATSPSDFWQRWHMSLSEWLRDYVYFPLGGSRKGFWRKLLNIAIVFLVSGFWHGATWFFVCWGLLHGLYRIAEELAHRCFGKPRELKSKALELLRHAFKSCAMFAASAFAFIFFKITYLYYGQYIFRHMAKWGTLQELVDDFYVITSTAIGGSIMYLRLWSAALLLCVCLAFVLDLLIYRAPKDSEYRYNPLMRMKTPVRWFCYIFMFAAILLLGRFGSSGFLYFMF
ncbi:MAG: MBOAT family O-acyltransferase [Oscillospiraceae bacterium]